MIPRLNLNRDSMLWWVILIASVLTYLSGHFELLTSAFPGMSMTWQSRIELLAGLTGMVAAYMRMSPRGLTPNGEMAGTPADPDQTLTVTGKQKDTLNP